MELAKAQIQLTSFNHKLAQSRDPRSTSPQSLPSSGVSNSSISSSNDSNSKDGLHKRCNEEELRKKKKMKEWIGLQKKNFVIYKYLGV